MQHTPQITPAHRVGQVKEYYFARKLRELAELRKQGRDIISLAIGGPDTAPPPAAIEALCHNARRSDTHSYQPGKGPLELRKAYSDWYEREFGVVLDPETDILPLIGSKEGVLHLSLTFLNPGDKVLVPDPGYPTYTSASHIAGAEPIRYSLHEQLGWQPDFEELRSLAPGVKMMWVNYPNMPTGAPSSRELLEKLVDFARCHGILLVNDNPYSFILHKERLSLLSVPGARDVAIEMNSLSKSHSMAGWRMGFVAARKEFIDWITRVKSNADSGQFLPMMRGAIAALSESDGWKNHINALYGQRRQIAEQLLHTLGCPFSQSQAGLFLWAHIPEQWQSAEQFSDALLEATDVFVTPGFIFGNNGKRFIRLSLCLPAERLREAAERIAASPFNKLSAK